MPVTSTTYQELLKVSGGHPQGAGACNGQCIVFVQIFSA
jgi:hypothetical protein